MQKHLYERAQSYCLCSPNNPFNKLQTDNSDLQAGFFLFLGSSFRKHLYLPQSC